MDEHLFLFGIALVWIVFAVVQDFRTREVANWLNFSLIAFVLAYRALYAVSANEYSFFIFGAAGVLCFVFLGYVFYYGRIFAGGDAKLLMGLGGVFPYSGFEDILIFAGSYILLFLVTGLLYTVVYSLFLVFGARAKFVKAFEKEFFKRKVIFVLGYGLGFVSLFLYFIFGNFYYILFFVLLVFIPLVFVYARALESAVMIKRVEPQNLREGDWILRDVRVKGRVIRKSVHGLSEKDIKLLRRSKRKIAIREGIPFTPAFLISFGIFLLWYFGVIGFRGFFF